MRSLKLLKEKVEVITCRVADQNNLHQAALKVVIKPLTEDCQVDVKTGIDGQQTNFGTQQLVEKNCEYLVTI